MHNQSTCTINNDDSIKQERVRIVREMNRLQSLKLTHGTDFKLFKHINDRIAALNIDYLNTFNDELELRELQDRLKSVKPTWNGAYTDWLGWGRKFTWFKSLDTPVSQKKLYLK